MEGESKELTDFLEEFVLFDKDLFDERKKIDTKKFLEDRIQKLELYKDLRIDFILQNINNLIEKKQFKFYDVFNLYDELNIDVEINNLIQILISKLDSERTNIILLIKIIIDTNDYSVIMDNIFKIIEKYNELISFNEKIYKLGYESLNVCLFKVIKYINNKIFLLKEDYPEFFI